MEDVTKGVGSVLKHIPPKVGLFGAIMGGVAGLIAGGTIIYKRFSKKKAAEEETEVVEENTEETVEE